MHPYRNLKKAAASLLACSILLGTAGCALSNSNAEVMRSKISEVREIQIFTPNPTAALSTAVEDMSPAERMYAAAERESGITFHFNTYQAETYLDKTYDDVCLERVRSHMGDDLILMNADVISTLGKEGLLSDLSSLEFVPKLQDCILAANTIDGKLVAVPFEIVAYGLFCNVELFERYGLELPNTPEDLLHCCKVFKENGFEYPIGANRWWLEIFVLSQGFAEMYINGNPEEEIAALNRGETKLSDYMRPGLEYLQTLFEEGYIDYQTAYTYEALDEGPAFRNQETPIVMSYQGAAAPERGYGELNFRMEVIGLPTHLGQVPVLSMTGSGIPESAAHKEDTIKVFNILMQEDNLVAFNNASGSISPFKGEIKGLETLKPIAKLTESVNNGHYVLATNGNYGVELWGNTCNIVQHLMSGSTVEECLAEFDALQQEALNADGKSN